MSAPDDRPSSGARRVVVLDADPDAGASLAALLNRRRLEARATTDPAVAAGSVRSEGVAALVVAQPARGADDLVRAVRATGVAVPVIALVDAPGAADDALVAGADSSLLRPVEIERLTEALDHLLDRRPAG